MTIVVQNNAMYVRPELGLLVKVGGPALSEELSGRIVGYDAQDGTCSVLADGKHVFHRCKFIQVDEAVENRPAGSYAYPQLLLGYPVIERAENPHAQQA